MALTQYCHVAREASRLYRALAASNLPQNVKSQLNSKGQQAASFLPKKHKFNKRKASKSLLLSYIQLSSMSSAMKGFFLQNSYKRTSAVNTNCITIHRLYPSICSSSCSLKKGDAYRKASMQQPLALFSHTCESHLAECYKE